MRERVVALVWAALLITVLLWPMLSGRGHFLARDLVFVPSQPMTWQAFGLGDGAPRAVPLNAWMSLLTQVVDGGALARIVVPGLLLLAAAGVLRMLPGAGVVPAMVAAGVAVWNPFVAERLALGQWALLLAYAVLPWLLVSLHRHAQQPGMRTLAPVVGWLVLGSVTPTGGLVLTGLVAVHLILRRAAAWWLMLAAVAVQAPWVVAGLVSTSANVSDAAGATVFAPDSEARWGPMVALLGLSGIWDSHSEPASRLGVLGLLTALVVVVVLVAGTPRLWREVPAATPLVVASALGLAWALLLATSLGRSLAEVLVARVPGAGLLRDGQKFLLPMGILVALATLVVVRRAVRTGIRVVRSPEVLLAGAVPLVLSPLLLLPDAARVVWPTVQPVEYPTSFTEVDALTRSSDGFLVTLPWRSYRDFSWGAGTTSSDPATRLLHTRVLTSDELQVGTTTVPGEGVLAAAVGEHLASGAAPSGLGALGVQWVLTYRDDPDAADLDLAGLTAVYEDQHVRLHEVPDVAVAPQHEAVAAILVVGAHGLVLVLLLLAGAGAVLGRRRPQSADQV